MERSGRGRREPLEVVVVSGLSGLRQEHRDPRARGPRLLLHRQPARRPDPALPRALPAARVETHQPRRPRHRPARAPVLRRLSARPRRAAPRRLPRRGAVPRRQPTTCWCAASARPAARTRSAAGPARLAGIQRERDELAELRERADRIIDTSALTVHQLREELQRLYRDPQRGRRAHRAAGLVRLQVRRADRRRHGARRALPRQPVLRRRAARRRPAATRRSPTFVLDRPEAQEFLAPHRGAARLHPAALPARGRRLLHPRHRLHRRPPPLGGAGRAPGAATWRGAATACRCSTETCADEPSPGQRRPSVRRAGSRSRTASACTPAPPRCSCRRWPVRRRDHGQPRTIRP